MRIGDAFSSNYIEYKSNGKNEKSPPPKKYLNKIRSYSNDLINNHRTQGE